MFMFYFRVIESFDKAGSLDRFSSNFGILTNKATISTTNKRPKRGLGGSCGSQNRILTTP